MFASRPKFQDFNVKVNFGRKIIENTYEGGSIEFINNCRGDRISLPQLDSLSYKLGYDGNTASYRKFVGISDGKVSWKLLLFEDHV